MNKVLAILILGMGFIGAVLIISIALLFKSSIGNVLQIVTSASILAFVIFTVLALLVRRRLDEKRE